MKDRLLYACMVNRFRCVRLFVTLRMVACQVPLSMGFSRHEYWSMLPCPPPGDLPNLGFKPVSLISPALADGFFTNSTIWETRGGHSVQFSSVQFSSVAQSCPTLRDPMNHSTTGLPVLEWKEDLKWRGYMFAYC